LAAKFTLWCEIAIGLVEVSSGGGRGGGRGGGGGGGVSSYCAAELIATIQSAAFTAVAELPAK